jgi:hypothetical protein
MENIKRIPLFFLLMALMSNLLPADILALSDKKFIDSSLINTNVVAGVVNARAFGTPGQAALVAAIADIGNKKKVLLVSPDTVDTPAIWPIDKDLTIPANIILKPDPGVILSRTGGARLTINGPVTAGMYQWINDTSVNHDWVAFGPGAVKEVCPEWWGAKGDSITPHQDIFINAALTAANPTNTSSSGGPEVKLFGKGYLVNNNILVPNSVTLSGAGDGNSTVLIANTNMPFLLRPKSIAGDQEYFKVKDLTINGNGKTFSAAVVDCQSIYNNSFIQDIVIWNYLGAPGLRFGPGTGGDGCGAVYVKNVWVLAGASGTPGIHVISKYGTREMPVEGITFDHVMVENCGTAPAVYIESTQTGYVRSLWFRGLFTRGCTGYALEIKGLYQSNISGAQISSGGKGIYIHPSATAPSFGNVFSNLYNIAGTSVMIDDQTMGYQSGGNVVHYAQPYPGAANRISVMSDSETAVITGLRSDFSNSGSISHDGYGSFRASRKLYATSGIGVGNSVANTRTPNGATIRALPLYDDAGTLLGYVPIYSSQW